MTVQRLSLLTVCLAVLAAAVLVPAAAAADPGVVVRVPASSRAAFAGLGVTPRASLDYGSFLWIELAAGDYDLLERGGVAHELVPDARQLRFMDRAFDPLADGEPALPAAMKGDPARPGFRLVQFEGPVRAEWLQGIAAAGARPLQYYPHNAYLVWARPEQAAAVGALPFVRWQGLFHPGYKIARNLDGRTGPITNVDVLVYDDGDLAATLDALQALGGEIVQTFPAQPDKAFHDVIVRLDASALADVARLATVWWLGHQSPRPILDDEMSSQILAGNHTGGVPTTGYFPHLASLGFDGTGVIWAVVDTGVDWDHPDLGPHVVGGFDFPTACTVAGQPGSDCSNGGHGTHVAGIIGGDATGGFTDGGGFLYGLGVAPGYGIFAMNSLSGNPWPPAGGWQEHSKRAVLGGAIGGNNSWTTGEGTNHGYQASERTHDLMVRDGDFDTTMVAEPFIEVFSAGNSGPSASTLTAPKEAKNLIVTASSRNFRVGSIDTLSGFSSRGPAVDGRWVPTIAAPGEQIASSRNDTGGVCATSIGGTSNLYAFCSGTSMASPHAAGAVVLATEWWRTLNAGADPSPAMAKALLVNSAVDMGTADRPNIHEGWGRIDVTEVIDPGFTREYLDQTVLFSGTGDQHQITVGVPDTGQPLKITLAWSDAAGAVGANPALVNNLDLTVENDGNVYRGNVFSGGWSATGGSADAINNLENVFVQSPGGTAIITIDATNVAGDGVPYNGDTTDQDFALVCSNCLEQPTFSLDVTPELQSVCSTVGSVDYTVDVGSVLGFTNAVTLGALVAPGGPTTGFGTNPLTPPDSTTLTVGNLGAAGAGVYDVAVDGTATGSDPHADTVQLELFTAAPGALTLSAPADGAINVPPLPTFTWTAAPNGGTYAIEIADDPGFTNVVESATGLVDPEYTATVPLALDTTYYWRVGAENPCGVEPFGAAFSFTTTEGTLQCNLTAVDFGAGIPIDWTVVDATGGTGIVWTTTGEAGCAIPNRTPGSGVAACADSDAAGSGAPPFDTSLVSNPIDATLVGGLELTLAAYYRDLNTGSNDRFEIDVWNGSAWINELSWDEDHEAGEIVTLDLDAYAGQSDVQVRFRFFGNGFDWFAQVDDVAVSCAESNTVFAGDFETGDLTGWSSWVGFP